MLTLGFANGARMSSLTKVAAVAIWAALSALVFPLSCDLAQAGPAVRPSSRATVDHDLLTRPMRLEEGVGSVRRARRDSLTGV